MESREAFFASMRDAIRIKDPAIRSLVQAQIRSRLGIRRERWTIEVERLTGGLTQDQVEEADQTLKSILGRWLN